VDPAKVRAYTTVGGTPMLDGGYTVFGKVIKGLDVIDSIAKQPTRADRPVDDIRMEVTVEEIPKTKITEQYGYNYPEKTQE
jgi:peptidyl-prolyl cis-trans isomerase B (cyclophilin B)